MKNPNDNFRNAGYVSKDLGYYENARRDFVSVLPANPEAAILELGCGNGATGALALDEGKCARYIGIEMFEPMALQAKLVLTAIHVGNVESMDLPYGEATFDALIMGEVLEHLVGPELVLRRLVQMVKPGGLVFASSPNISHWRPILGLILGRFEYQDQGVMDRTHLRWFTPKSFRRMFEEADVVVDHLGPLVKGSHPKRMLFGLLGRRLSHLAWSQMTLHGHRAQDVRARRVETRPSRSGGSGSVGSR